jgi:hypothetical protein
MSILLGIGLGIAWCRVIDGIIYKRRADIIAHSFYIIAITITILKVKGVF